MNAGRPTEISENDVYVCESVYDESNRVARKLKSGLRKFEHTKDVTVDEVIIIIFFLSLSFLVLRTGCS